MGGALLLVLVVGMIATGQGYAETPVLVGAMLLLLMDAIILAPAVVIALHVRKSSEVRAGYTTVTNQYPEVDQIDPNSGYVVRLAGEETLSRGEYFERIRLIREAVGGGKVKDR